MGSRAAAGRRNEPLRLRVADHLLYVDPGHPGFRARPVRNRAGNRCDERPRRICDWTSLLVGFFVCLVLAHFGIRAVWSGARKVARSESIAVSYLKAIKQGVCPLITFRDNALDR